MSLQSEIGLWKSIYDEYTVNTSSHRHEYTGSILDTRGYYHDGYGKYMSPPSVGVLQELYDFNWYAGQGLDIYGFGGKYLLYSECGFSWTMSDVDGDRSVEVETFGSLDTLYLGYNADTNASPAEATLTAFCIYDPLLVVSNFDVAVDYVASTVFGIADGNSLIAPSVLNSYGLVTDYFFPGYEVATLNAAVIQDLVYDSPTNSSSTFEFVLDQYLSGISGGVIDNSDTISDINMWLSANGSDLVLEYYSMTSDYVSDGVVSEALAEAYLNASGCSGTTVSDGDLLMAA